MPEKVIINIMLHPLVTVILPIRNEGAYIFQALDAIIAQDYPGSMEILVVDGMSTDRTRAIIEEYQLRYPNILLIDNPGKIVPTGMNAALPHAKGEIIVRVDGHCLISSDYVRRCVDHLLIDGVNGVGGPMKTIGETPISDTIAVSMSSSFGVGNSAFRTSEEGTRLVDTVPFPAYTRQTILKAGAYDEELVRNQDDEYNYRIRENGGKLLLADDVRSQYFSRGSLKKLWRQYLQYGFYKVRVLQKHPRQMSLRQFIPPAFVLSVISSLVSSLLVSWGWILLALVLGVYFVSNLGASVYTAARRGWKHLLLLPICYAILHLSYGVGFLMGLIHFSDRWGDRIGKVPVLRMTHE